VSFALQKLTHVFTPVSVRLSVRPSVNKVS
jgi:hypothetical protein